MMLHKASNLVHPESVEGCSKLTASIRPELVEGCSISYLKP